MRHSSGFGWDPITKRFTVDDESHPMHVHFRTETFPDYEDLKIAVGNGTATEMGSISLGDDPNVITYATEENGHWEIDGFVFNRTTNMFVQVENESSHQENSQSLSQQLSQGTNADAPPNSRTQGKTE
ncbi:uncharacterized protein At2g29880-like [Rosa rugosa]|uniref:uncharacterized protein At2g29880-like n=1 Tax=Rosa rugosa TaxID=74645 RepID=UPI002B406ECB|nr:uncharacterized protein At2g29880-like [Rosa rugosa]